MTSTSPQCRPQNKKRFRILVVAAALLIAALLITMGAMMKSDLEPRVALAGAIYAVIASCFFGAQIWGFVVSQLRHSEKVEAPKYKIIENEEAEWKGLACLMCGVDTGPIRNAFIFGSGGLVLASLLIFIWALSTQRLKRVGDARLAIEAEERGEDGEERQQ